MWVTGAGEGTFCEDLNPFQYLCSGVIGEGPEGSFRSCSLCTGCAILQCALADWGYSQNDVEASKKKFKINFQAEDLPQIKPRV